MAVGILPVLKKIKNTTIKIYFGFLSLPDEYAQRCTDVHPIILLKKTEGEKRRRKKRRKKKKKKTEK